MVEHYKRDQGVLVRRVSFWALMLFIVWGGDRLYGWLTARFDFAKTLLLEDVPHPQGFTIPLISQKFDWAFVICWVVVIASGVVLWRLLNRPRSAEFLIDTDSELKKVTWPTWKDAWNSSLIVVVFVVVLTTFLVGSDWLLNLILIRWLV